MKFRTEIDIPQASSQIDYSSKILSLGSCFASSIGQRLLESKFKIFTNPIGVLFNPLSIASTLKRFKERRHITIDELKQGREVWFHFDFHGSLSDTTAEATLQNINNAIDTGATAFEECDTIIITLGTIWVYQLLENDRVVANCHKEPAKSFIRRAISIDEITDSLSGYIERYPTKRFIFSVSPIRHLADGLAENSLSKATLRVAIAQMVEKYDNASYFPAYEILLDDLRDYRFYADDMLHPSQRAVEYIWQKFSQSNISNSALSTMDRVANIVKAAAHRPLNPSSRAHIEFCRKQLELIKELPEIDLGKENVYFMTQLQNNL